MPASDAQDEADTIRVPPPNAVLDLFGHGEAERAFAAALQSGRLPHGWLITGPEGIGKATLAFRAARYLLASPEHRSPDPHSLAVDPASPAAYQIAQGVTQDLMVVERAFDEKKGALKSVIPAEAAREVSSFFSMRSGSGGYRVAVVDALDHLNRFGQNALLKILEEPPPKGVVLLLAHNAGRVLPTIRSRCRHLALGPVDTGAIVDFVTAKSAAWGFTPPTDQNLRLIAAMAGGAPGWALRLHFAGAPDLLARLARLMAAWPSPRDQDVFAFADAAAAAESQCPGLPARLMRDFLQAAAKAAAGQAEAALLPGCEPALEICAQRGSAAGWSQAWSDFNALLGEAGAINIDFRQTLIESIRRICLVPA